MEARGIVGSQGGQRPAFARRQLRGHLQGRAEVDAFPDGGVRDLSQHHFRGEQHLSMCSTNTRVMRDVVPELISRLACVEQIVESEPALNVTSVVHTITVHKVTNNNTAFVQWDSDFSNDATSEVLLDRCVLRNRCWPRREVAFCWRTSDGPICCSFSASTRSSRPSTTWPASSLRKLRPRLSAFVSCPRVRRHHHSR